MEKHTVEISWQEVVKIFVLTLALFAVYYFRDLIMLFIASVVIAVVVEGPATALIRKGFPRFLAVAAIYLGFISFVSLFAYLLTPVLIEEFQGFTESFLGIFNRVFRLNFLLPETIAEVQTSLIDIIQGFGRGAGAALQFASRFVNAVFTLIVVFVTSFYLALQGRTMERIIKILAPDEHISYFNNLWERSQLKIGRWFYGQVILSFTVGFAVFLGLWFLGVNYALLIGIIAGVLEIVPVVGPVISGLIALTIAAQQGTDLALYTVILFVIIQQVENNALIPLVMRRFIGLNPVVVVFALLIGGKLAGIWGVILAVPLTAALGELIADWENKRFLVTK